MWFGVGGGGDCVLLLTVLLCVALCVGVAHLQVNQTSGI